MCCLLLLMDEQEVFLQAGAAAPGSGVSYSPGMWGQPEEAKIIPKNEPPFEAGELAAPSPAAGASLQLLWPRGASWAAGAASDSSSSPINDSKKPQKRCLEGQRDLLMGLGLLQQGWDLPGLVGGGFSWWWEQGNTWESLPGLPLLWGFGGHSDGHFGGHSSH